MIKLCVPMGRIATVYCDDTTYTNCTSCDRIACNGQCLLVKLKTDKCQKCPRPNKQQDAAK